MLKKEFCAAHKRYFEGKKSITFEHFKTLLTLKKMFEDFVKEFSWFEI